MGNTLGTCCSSNLFADLRQKYGATFTKLMLAEKAKDFIGEHFGQLTATFAGLFGNFKDKVAHLVGGRKQEVHQIYERVKLQANNKLPGGIAVLETVRGQPIDELSGYNQLQGKIDQIQDHTFTKIDNEQTQLLSSMGTKKQEMVTHIEQERPKIEYYEALPDPVKELLRREAGKVLAEEIKDNQGAIMEQIGKEFSEGRVEQLLGAANPEGELGKIVGEACKMLESALGLDVGGLFQKGLSIFG